MKSLVFKKIYLLSQKEHRGRAIEFHPQTNLIVGRNHTGKSSLIKTIYKTLGAKPAGKLRKWDEGTISIVVFLINDREFKTVFHMGYRGLFDEKDELLILTGDHQEWSRAFAKYTGFNLLVINKEQRTVSADPACFFLPFYVDQDGSWQSNWDTFPSSKGLKAPQKAVLEYFTGIKPPEWYEAESQRRKIQRILDDLKNEKHFLERARDRLKKALPMSGPKVNPDNFEYEVRKLTEEVNCLNEKQEVLRQTAVNERELIASIESQIHLSLDALKTYEGDTSYLSGEREKLICPTCNAEHSESFLDLFHYAEDARILRALIFDLGKDLENVRSKHEQTKIDFKNLESTYRNISHLLEVRKGEMRFDDVVTSMSAEHALQAFSVEHDELQEKINEQINLIEKLTERLRELTDKKRSKEILKDFREFYANALVALNIPAINMQRIKLNSRPDLSGSGGPRQILAYYSAVWKVAMQHGDFSIPIVVDSPNQQGQDEFNLPKVLEFVSTKLPRKAQVIIGSEIDTEYEFDKKIELTHQYQILQDTEFESVNAIVEPYTKTMLAKLYEKQ